VSTPLSTPVRIAEGLAPEGTRRTRVGCPLPIRTLILGSLLLQRIAIPGTNGIVSIGLPVGLAATIFGLLSGRLLVDPIRLLLFCAMLCGLLVALVFQSGRPSFTSIALLLSIYLPFVLVAPVSLGEYREILRAFGNVMAILSIAGIGQFAIQFVLGPEAMFPLDGILPPPWFIQGFNLKIPILDGFPWLKSTGVVFLEPSHFAQSLALAIVVELLLAARFWILGLYGLAYLVTFSGTGLVLLALLAVPACWRARRLGLLAFAIPIGLAAWFLSAVPPFALFFGRLDEFTNPLSSGAMRFVGPYWLTAELAQEPLPFLFGRGAGALEDVTLGLDRPVQDTLWLKLLVEYGLLGLVSFAPFYLYVLFAGAPERLLGAAVLIQVLFLGGYLNAYYVQFLALALVGWPRLADPSPPVGGGAR